MRRSKKKKKKDLGRRKEPAPFVVVPSALKLLLACHAHLERKCRDLESFLFQTNVRFAFMFSLKK